MYPNQGKNETKQDKKNVLVCILVKCKLIFSSLLSTNRSRELLKWAYIHGVCQGLSTFMGYLFPFCRNVQEWNVAMTASMVLYLFIFERWRVKYNDFIKIQKGTRLDEREIYNRSYIALQLLTTCVIGWTIVVGCYFIFCCFGPMYASPDSFLGHKSTPMVSNCILDVCLKSFYNFWIVRNLWSCHAAVVACTCTK